MAGSAGAVGRIVLGLSGDPIVGRRGKGDPVLRIETVRRELRGIAIALVMVAATTLVA